MTWRVSLKGNEFRELNEASLKATIGEGCRVVKSGSRMVAVAMGDSCPANRDASFAAVAVTPTTNSSEISNIFLDDSKKQG